MNPKATTAMPRQPQSPPDPPGVTGKWLVIGVFGVALAAAIGSWVFRYNATHRVAGFWGSTNAVLIRDAPQIDFYYLVAGEASLSDADLLKKLTRPGACTKVDVSKGRGMLHLRNALTEDRSFDWQAPAPPSPPAGWMLRFSDSSTRSEVWIAFSKSAEFCRRLSDTPAATPAVEIVSCEPISAGLRKVFEEFATNSRPTADPAAR